MGIQLHRPVAVVLATTLWGICALIAGCAGSGKGLDANGNPISATSSAPAALAANFQSIQDNVFTPICTRCHIGASAPEGLQLDQAHSYALLVGVPSAEVPSVLRVKAGDPTDSYIIQKLQGSSGIVGVQMPFGGPYLPQSTIDVIRQWITNGAAAATSATAAVARELSGQAAFGATATMPADGSAVAGPIGTIAIGFSQPPDPSYLNGAIRIETLTALPVNVPAVMTQAEGNLATILLTPLAPLMPGSYRVTLRGGEPPALTSMEGAVLPADFSFTFTVESP